MKLRGFKTSAESAGIKSDNRLDLALIFSEVPSVAAAVFTQNTFVAAPLIVSKRHLQTSGQRVRAVLVNSGNANAATGAEGIRAAETCARTLAEQLRCAPDEVLVSSTGVIGMRLPVEKMREAIPSLVRKLDIPEIDQVARAIMTTDTFPKIAEESLGGAHIVGVAKGAGMIHPDMATMLAFIMTDAAVSATDLDRTLRHAVHQSFNSISVDGDTSTNDMVVVLANGASGVQPNIAVFSRKLTNVCEHLAKDIVRDGEGASKFVELRIEGAPSDEAARHIGRTIARSPLVKTAIYGADPNWGRIIGAIGNSGIPLASDEVDIFIEDVPISSGDLDRAREKLRQRDVRVRVVLRSGSGAATVWTCDLTEQYIRINADYTT